MNDALPRTLGRYRLLSLLGEGGMGKVYRGFDSTLERSVAIKVLLQEFVANPSRLTRFVQEARSASALNHTNVVTVYDIGEEHFEGDDERVRYIAMELVEGKTLRELTAGPLDLQKGLKIAIQVAEGVSAAHAAGIVHRDLKPENIMVNASGVAKVLDFGLAKLRPSEALNDSDTRTIVNASEPGTVLGTVGYMSPEQAQGLTVDARSDVFSFGCVLYEIATGQRAFDGDSAIDTLHKILHGEPAPLREIRADLPPELARIVRKALAKDPDERYQSVKEVAIDLRDLARELDSNPSVSGFTSAPPAPTRRKPRLSFMVIAIGIAGIVAMTYTLARWWRGHASAHAAQPLEINRLTASGKVIHAVISPDAKLTAYVESNQGEQTLIAREMASGQTLTLVPPRQTSYWGIAFSPDSSTVYFAVKDKADPAGAMYRISTLGGRLLKIIDAVDSQPTFSPDGKQIAFLRAAFPSPHESAVIIADADGSNARTLAKVHAPEFFVPIFVAGASWSPDGKMIAASIVGRALKGNASAARIVSIDVANGSMKTIADHGWAIIAQVAWMPDQKGLVAIVATSAERLYQVWYVPYPSGEPQPVTRDFLDYRIASLTADGKSLLTVASDVNADVWILRDGQAPHRINASKAEGIYGVASLPDGRLVTASAEAGKLDLFVMNEDGSARMQITRDAYANRSPAVTPDGKRVVYLSVTPGGSEICRINIDGSGRTVLARTSNATASLDLSPDGTTVVYEDLSSGNIVTGAGRPGVFQVSIDGGPSTRLGTDGLAAPTFSPDGTKIAGLLRGANQLLHLATIPAAGGPATEVSNWAASSYSMTRWTADGNALVVNTAEGDRKNLWMIPIDGSARRKLTDFDDHIAFVFAPLTGGKGWIVSRGDLSRDAVLITGFRPPE
jgi:serine/threonine protein kinase